LPCAPHPTMLLPAAVHSVCLQQKRVASLRTRTVSTVAMIAGFLGVIYAGHVPLVFLVLGLQVRPVFLQSMHTVIGCHTSTAWDGLVLTQQQQQERCRAPAAELLQMHITSCDRIRVAVAQPNIYQFASSQYATEKQHACQFCNCRWHCQTHTNSTTSLASATATYKSISHVFACKLRAAAGGRSY
jgi:hypothetical protein